MSHQPKEGEIWTFADEGYTGNDYVIVRIYQDHEDSSSYYAHLKKIAEDGVPCDPPLYENAHYAMSYFDSVARKWTKKKPVKLEPVLEEVVDRPKEVIEI